MMRFLGTVVPEGTRGESVRVKCDICGMPDCQFFMNMSGKPR